MRRDRKKDVSCAQTNTEGRGNEKKIGSEEEGKRMREGERQRREKKEGVSHKQTNKHTHTHTQVIKRRLPSWGVSTRGGLSLFPRSRYSDR